MRGQDGCDEGRRAFLWDAMRYSVLGALGVVAAFLVRHQETLDADEKCTIAQACRRCPAREKCRLPQAELARRTFDRV